MSYVLSYHGQYFKLDVTELFKAESNNSTFVVWCSDKFTDLKDAPKRICSRLIPGTQPTPTEALQHAVEWVKAQWEEQLAKHVRQKVSLMYTVWLFKGEESTGFEFVDFTTAKTFAESAQNSWEVTKIGITNNESPQYLTIWEK